MYGFGLIQLRKFRGIAALLVLAAVLLTACQPAAAPTSAPQATQAPAATMAPAATEAPAATATVTMSAPASEATINVVDNPEYGPILVDGKGMTLYIFTKDAPDKSNCAGECLQKWPPLLTQGNPTLGDGVDPKLVGSTALEDGSMIVTYNHLPLYYWWKDSKPGDTDGQGVGEVWYVINPAGEMIQAEEPGETPAATTAAAGAAPAAAEASIMVANDPTLGPILVDGKGMTLYIYTRDVPDVSNCAGECLEKWPPLLTQGAPTLGEGVDPALVGFTTLADGSKIVTYNHLPLYYWVKDTKPGDTTGQGVGEVWYVIAPDGTVIK